ncbi:hypothetical protein BGX34_000264 [Mortierella sp. NVP85]|nr:hypothetical protein BGX34_000264 [Mortierella sp. NVP85]
MVDFHAFATNENTLLVSKIATVASIGIYAGTSLSFNTIIMPALRKFSSSSSVAIWNETVNAARAGQFASAVLAVLGGAGLYYGSKNASYLYSAASMFLTIPYTALVIQSVDNKLFEIRHNNTVNGKNNSMKDSKSEDSEADSLLKRWNLLHAGRTVLGVGALLTTVYGIVSDSGVRFIIFK